MQDLTGRRFGHITVLGFAGLDGHRSAMWHQRCDCGAVNITRGSTLVAGRTQACKSCANSKSKTTHGMSRTVLYQRWRAMLDRTGRSEGAEYHNYGGRGITVCPRWRQFEAFAADMGPTFSPGLELDRIDVNGHYEPSNCRWITKREQQLNKRTNHRVEWRGETRTIQEWSEILGIKPNTLVHRLRRDWGVERAFLTPAMPRRSRTPLRIAAGEAP